MVKVVAQLARIAALAALVGGCSVQKHLKRGDAALASGEYIKAVEAYEDALRVSPGHKKAQEGINKARREAVRSRLALADAALSKGELPTALAHATVARRMPLDLEDVELVRRIDATIDKAAQLAEERVQQMSERGRFVAAVELAEQIVEASPGVTSRKKWADEVRAKAVEHYSSLARALAGQNLFGSAAIQLAMARRSGAQVPVGDILAHWNRFAEPTCFAKPTVAVVDRTGKARDLVAKIEATAQDDLAELRSRCGEGNRKLGVQIELMKVDLVDTTTTDRAAKPLPGSKVKTEEVYYEEEPYTEMEEVTEYITRTEKQERRDCAPRPGKERGCVTWVEDVEVKVPVVKKKEVQKVRRIEKRRPVKGPLPADQVLTYDVTAVTRRARYDGQIVVTGEATVKRAFVLQRESVDQSHARAESPKLVIPADPLEVKEMSEVTADAAEAVAQEVRTAVAEAARTWAETFADGARKQVLGGQMPQAEELYLRMLALGNDGGEELSRFFADRYGRTVGEVMDLLSVAMGRAVEEIKGGDASAAATARFPRRAAPVPGEGDGSEPEEAPQPVPVATPTRAPAMPSKEPGVHETRMSDDELNALEQESMQVLGGGKPPEPGAKPDDKTAPPAGDGDRQPVPIKPK
ncbi:MAG: hypothetical protein HYZ27_01240 [Deltaproteobacteria bacterium]|nr:hypothetical protein [Deltaproteobacteria bacterium]